MKFTINKEQKEKFKQWLKRHNPDCIFRKTKKEGATTGRITYMFTPTDVGTTVAAHCLCGKRVDLTLCGKRVDLTIK